VSLIIRYFYIRQLSDHFYKSRSWPGTVLRDAPQTEPLLTCGKERAASDFMTKERFDQFKNKILKLSQEADVFWEQFNELKTTKDMVVRLARKQKHQVGLAEEKLQKANEEIKVIKFALEEASEKIKELEKEKMELVVPDTNENNIPAQDTIDLEMMAQDFDTKMVKKAEEEKFNSTSGFYSP